MRHDQRGFCPTCNKQVTFRWGDNSAYPFEDRNWILRCPECDEFAPESVYRKYQDTCYLDYELAHGGDI